MPAQWLPLTLALLPIATVASCYVISASAGFIPACFPFTQGCTTVSSAGRYGAAYPLFKAGLIPTTGLMMLFWPLCRRWYLDQGVGDSRGLRAMVWLGVIAAVFLLIYTVALGSTGELYKFMRRSGVTVYFGFGYLAQVLLLNRIWQDHRDGLLPAMSVWVPRGMMTVALLMLAMGLYSIPLEEVIPDPDKVVINSIEWNFALLMFVWFLLPAAAWAHSDASQHSGQR